MMELDRRNFLISAGVLAAHLGTPFRRVLALASVSHPEEVQGKPVSNLGSEPRFHYPHVIPHGISVASVAGKPAETYVVKYKAHPFTDLPFYFTTLPNELLGVISIRLSFAQAQHDCSLSFETKEPVRVYVGFAAGSPRGWLASQPDWTMFAPDWTLFTETYVTSDYRQVDLSEIRYRDFPAGQVTLFPGHRGAYCLLGIQTFYWPAFPYSPAESAEEMQKRDTIYNCLYPTPWPLPPTREMIHDYDFHQTQIYLGVGLDRLMAIHGVPQWEALRQGYADAVQRSIGQFPERTALNAQTVGRVDNPDAVIEKVIFESRPKFYVTGNLYLPRQPLAKRSPAVLILSGHYNEAKADGPHRELCLRLARSGVVAFVIDCIGQGERSYYLDGEGNRMFSHNNPETGVPGYVNPCTEHGLLGFACLLTGTGLAQYFMWDNIRAIDYLSQRPEVDPKRIAVTGVSGGSVQSEYLAAIDPRLAMVAPCPPNMLMELLRRAEVADASFDAEEQFFGLVKEGLDNSAIIAMAAPRPYEILTTFLHSPLSGDPGSHELAREGTRESVAVAKHVYDIYGAADHLHIAEDTAGHAYTPRLQESFFASLSEWLGGTRPEAWEGPVHLNSAQELQCTRSGQVKTSLRDARWVPDFNRERARVINPKRPLPTDKADLEKYQDAVRRAMCKAIALDLPPMLPNHFKRLKQDEWMVTESQWLGTETGVTVSCAISYPNKAGRFPAVLLISDPSNDAIEEVKLRESLVGRGWAMMTVETRGVGFTGVDSTAERSRLLLDECKEEYLYVYSHALYLMHTALGFGTSLFARRLLDVRQCLRYLSQRPEINPQLIAVVGRGEEGVLAMCASALDPSIAGCAALGSPLGYRMVVDADVYAVPPGIAVWDVLSHFDLPEVAACLAPRPFWLGGPVDETMKPVREQVAIEAYQPARTAYAVAQAEKSLAISVAEDGWIEWLNQSINLR